MSLKALGIQRHDAWRLEIKRVPCPRQESRCPLVMLDGALATGTFHKEAGRWKMGSCWQKLKSCPLFHEQISRGCLTYQRRGPGFCTQRSVTATLKGSVNFLGRISPQILKITEKRDGFTVDRKAEHPPGVGFFLSLKAKEMGGGRCGCRQTKRRRWRSPRRRFHWPHRPCGDMQRWPPGAGRRAAPAPRNHSSRQALPLRAS